MNRDMRGLAPLHYEAGRGWWPGWIVDCSRLFALAVPASPRWRHRHVRRPWRTFTWNWGTTSIVLVPSLCMMWLFGAADRHAWLAALVTVTFVSLLRTLVDAGTSRRLPAPLPLQEIVPRVCDAAACTAPAPTATAGTRLATCKEFDDAVRRALTHLSDPTRLATSPLLHLVLVTTGLQAQGLQDTRLNRGTALKAVLTDLLEGLRPLHHAGSPVGEAWRFYNCLYYPYVQGASRRYGPTILRRLQERRRSDGGAPTDAERVIRWLLQLDENTFYKWQRRGSDTIAGALREREAAAGGAVPEEVGERPALRWA